MGAANELAVIAPDAAAAAWMVHRIAIDHTCFVKVRPYLPGIAPRHPDSQRCTRPGSSRKSVPRGPEDPHVQEVPEVPGVPEDPSAPSAPVCPILENPGVPAVRTGPEDPAGPIAQRAPDLPGNPSVRRRRPGLAAP